MLAGIPHGRKLPPYIVFKDKTMPKERLQKKSSWPHARKEVDGWKPSTRYKTGYAVFGWPGQAAHLPSLLVQDSFRDHLVSSVQATLKNFKATLASIPGGLISVLEPLDVNIGKPFKYILWRLRCESDVSVEGNTWQWGFGFVLLLLLWSLSYTDVHTVDMHTCPWLFHSIKSVWVGTLSLGLYGNPIGHRKLFIRWGRPADRCHKLYV